MRCRLLLRAVFFVLAATSSARASEHPAVLLSWSGPDECPNGERVLARLERLLSRTELGPERLVVDANVVPDAEGFRLELSTGYGKQRSQRSIRAASCGDLADAAAVILALLIDPTLRSEATAPNQATELSVPNQRPSPRVPSAPPAPLREPGVRRRWAALAGPLLDFGSLPTTAPGLELGGFAGLGRVGVGLTAVWLPFSQRQVVEASAERPAKGGTFSLLAGHLRACYRFSPGIPLAGCAEAELGVLRGQGFGTAADSDRNVLWAAAGPGLEAALPLASWVVLRGGASALLCLRRPEFVLDNVDKVYRPQLVPIRLALGLLLYFP
jgi:hypothetical protein